MTEVIKDLQLLNYVYSKTPLTRSPKGSQNSSLYFILLRSQAQENVQVSEGLNFVLNFKYPVKKYRSFIILLQLRVTLVQ